jgi:hypothetical protein
MTLDNVEFRLSDEQIKRVNDWLEFTARPAAINLQKAQSRNPARYIVEDYWNVGRPYGETISFEFSSSSGIGVNAYVIHRASPSVLTLDITEHENW